ncbi:SAM-dependent methyltransferase, partial [Micromonospora chalcea]
GCHTARDTVAAIRAAGFEVTALDRFRFPPTGLPAPASPHVLGAAIRA